MPALIAKGDPGIDREIVIDGISPSVLPSSIDLRPDPVGDFQDMLDGGGREWERRPHFDGVANRQRRYTAEITFGNLVGENRVLMEEIEANGGTHRVVLWRMIPTKFTCKAGLQRYYLPMRRACAAWVYEGLQLGTSNVFVDTVQFPTEATLDGDALTVTYAEGPTLADPGAGGLVISRQPDSSGAAADYTAFRIGDVPIGGEILTIWMAPSMEMSLRAPQIGVSYRKESHSYSFVEL